MIRTLLKTLTAAGLATVAMSAVTGVAMAETLRDDWCSDVRIRFFTGGAEGDAFASIVYNGAVQAAKDTGAQVDYVFSGWSAEKMIQQLREAVGAAPDGIAMMGHPGNAAIMPLAEEAATAGIKMMYQNVPVDEVTARFGGGYVGCPAEAAGPRSGRRSDPSLRSRGGRCGDRHERLVADRARGARARHP